jgi:hypothetical protein
MALKAKNGYAAYCRQDFLGIDYAILDCATNDPLPDYFGGVLWSRLMGTGAIQAIRQSLVMSRLFLTAGCL